MSSSPSQQGYRTLVLHIWACAIVEISQLQAYHKQFDSRTTNTIVLGGGGMEAYVSRVSGLSLEYGVCAVSTDKVDL